MALVPVEIDITVAAALSDYIDHGDLTVTRTVNGITTTETITVTPVQILVPDVPADAGSTFKATLQWVDQAGHAITTSESLTVVVDDPLPAIDPGVLGMHILI